MPLLRREKKEKTKTIAIVDVGSAGVGSALAELDREGPPAILAHARTEIPLGPSRESAKLAQKTLAAARSAMEKTAKAGKPEHVALFLPAPWSSLHLHTIRLSPKKPFRINPAVVERMVAECIQKDHPKEHEETVIERSAVGIRLNGYAVEDIPKDASVHNAELTVVSVTAPHSFITALRDEAKRAFGPHVPLSFHSTSIAASYALSTLAPETGDYLLCNSEGEIAECLLVLEHSPVGSATAPAGCNAILRTLSTHADMARAEASSALALARNATSPMARKLEGTLKAAQKECAEGFRAASKELLDSSAGAPRLIYMLGTGSEGQWFADAVARAPFAKKLFPGGIAVKTLTLSDLDPHVLHAPTHANTHRGNGDLFLSLEAIFADARFDRRLTFNFKTKA